MGTYLSNIAISMYATEYAWYEQVGLQRMTIES